MAEGDVSRDDRLARRLAVSPRTLQRQLAVHGTTWRAELDTARQRRRDLRRSEPAEDQWLSAEMRERLCQGPDAVQAGRTPGGEIVAAAAR